MSASQFGKQWCRSINISMAVLRMFRLCLLGTETPRKLTGQNIKGPVCSPRQKTSTLVSLFPKRLNWQCVSHFQCSDLQSAKLAYGKSLYLKRQLRQEVGMKQAVGEGDPAGVNAGGDPQRADKD